MKNDERLKSFLIELKELCGKHGVLISGCGCCGSPGVDCDDKRSYNDLRADGSDCYVQYFDEDRKETIKFRG